MSASQVTIQWDYQPSMPFIGNIQRWEAPINDRGYVIHFFPDREAYTATVGNERIGHEYSKLAYAMDACARVAKLPNIRHTWFNEHGMTVRGD